MPPLGDPIAAFNREVLTILHWSFLREEFCTRFLEVFDPEPLGQQSTGRGRGRGGRGGAPPPPIVQQSEVIEERHRFRRHCREALGKWVLSQKGRDAAAMSFYFPTRQSAAQPPLATLSEEASVTTYDEQLIRDLSMKCTKTARDRPNFADDIRQFIQVTFSLAERCFAAHEAIELSVGSVPSLVPASEEPARKKTRDEKAQPLRPVVTVVTENEKSVEGHKRIQGDIVEVSVDVNALVSSFADHFSSNRVALAPLFYRSTGDINLRQLGGLTRVVVPRVAWDKLAHLYKNAGHAAEDSAAYSADVADRFGDSVTVEMLRCATLALRYEGNLATGSLQLCADETLKTLLVSKGYHVIDLCASPINAFQMACSDRGGGFSTHFCSAFIDTDKPFGSIGSATVVDLEAFISSFCAKAPASVPPRGFLFTLDVPYDEDLCNMLFLKLAADCGRLSVGERREHERASFLLVLPLWWSLTFAHAPKVHSPTDKPEDVARALASAVAYMAEGYPVPYPWPSVLEPSDWACFDAVFVKDSYSYFCTATNRLLTGVTATEVIGFECPKTGSALRSALNEFYKL